MDVTAYSVVQPRHRRMKETMSKLESLRVCTWNVCLGVRYKLRQVEEVMRKNEIDIMCIQEAEITDHEDHSQIEINGYTSEIEKSIGKRRSMIYIKNTIQYERHTEREKTDTHVILLTINAGDKKLKLASIYRAFKLSTKNTHKEEFSEQLEILKSHLRNDQPSIVVGDFNIDYNRKGHLHYNHHALFTMLDQFENEMHLTQIVKFNTWRRVVNGQLKTSLLDHVYENIFGLVEKVTEISSSTSDHSPVLININVMIEQITEKIVVRNWSNYSIEKLEELLRERNWDIDCTHVQDYNNELEQNLMTVLETLIPFEEKKIRKNNFSEPNWLSDMKRKRKNLFKNATRRKNATLFMKCKELDRKIKKEELKTNKKRIRNKILSGGQKGLWEAVKMAENKPHNAVPKEMTQGNEKFTTDKELAQGFAEFFKKKVEDIVKETEIDQNIYNGKRKINAPNDNFFTKEKVLKTMQGLKDKSCYGVDNIPVKILRDGCKILAGPYHVLLNKIYEQNVIPEQWKTSRVLPLYKKGKRSQMENYRPISNLCAGSKILERLILERILDLEDNANCSLTGDNQHGFKKNRSTLTAAAEIQSKIAALMDQDQYVAMASLDLSAAFDVVDVQLLLKRLRTMGIPEDVTNLLEMWLTERQFYVEVRQNCSQYYDSNCGTVQGSILGPVLFSLFVSPLLEKENLTSYADDSYLARGSKNKEEALRRLQFQLERVKKWLTGSGLKVNVEKTELIIFHRLDSADGALTINGVEIKSKKEISVLGLVFDSKLDWSQQVEMSARKSRAALQGLRMIAKYFTTQEKLCLLTTYVYSRLYYGAQIWLLPSLKLTLKNKLYSASGTALKLLDRSLTYKELHKQFNRATPSQFQKYVTAVSFYDLVKREMPEDDWINLQFNIQNDRRNIRLSFQKSNNYKCGMNCLSNRFQSITNEVEKEWIDLTRDAFKTRQIIAHCFKSGSFSLKTGR